MSSSYVSAVAAADKDQGISVIIRFAFQCFLVFVPIGLVTVWSRRDPLSWRAFRRSSRGMLGLILTVVFLFLGLFGPHLSSVDPTIQELALRLAPPGHGHLFGMDHLGRDLLSRVLHGARISMIVGVRCNTHIHEHRRPDRDDIGSGGRLAG